MVLGRFWQVDPKPDEAGQEELTPYHFAYNNPILHIDLMGDNPDDPWYKKAADWVGSLFKGSNQGLNNQQHSLYKTGGDTKFGIKDNTLGRVKDGKPVGAPVLRVDVATKQTPFPHINGPKGTNIHIPLAGGDKTLKALEATGKALEVVSKIAKPVAIATDAVRLGTAYQQDGGKVGNNTITTAGSVAGGWAGAWGGAALGAKGGAVVGSFFGPGPGTAAGAFIGGLGGGIIGAFVGSAAGEKVAETIIEKK